MNFSYFLAFIALSANLILVKAELNKLAVFGGTGTLGSEVVRYALEKGKEVRILVRNESTIPADFNGKVTIIKGDVLKKEDVERTLEGTDAVVITLGTRNKFNATTVMSEGTKNVVEAMKKSGLKKFSACMSSFLFRPADQVPPMVREIDADHRRMLEVIKESGLEYRAILPPHITAEPSRDFTTLYDKSPGRTISKFDLGKFFVDSLEVEEHSGKVIGIANVSLLT